MAGLSFELIALQLFTGLALGAIYVLFAIGLSLIFGMLDGGQFRPRRLLHGRRLCRAVSWCRMSGNFWLCLVAVPLVRRRRCGMLVERFLVRPLYGRGIDYPLLLTFGLSYIMVELVRIVFGTERLSVRHAARCCRARSISASAISRCTACS